MTQLARLTNDAEQEASKVTNVKLELLLVQPLCSQNHDNPRDERAAKLLVQHDSRPQLFPLQKNLPTFG